MIDDDAPMTLAEACQVIFRGAISPATLRAEAERGNLVIERIGRRDFVTARSIREMREKCRGHRKERTSSSGKTEGNGSYATATPDAAQAALELIVQERKRRSRPTSRASTSRPSTVVPFSSRMS